MGVDVFGHTLSYMPDNFLDESLVNFLFGEERDAGVPCIMRAVSVIDRFSFRFINDEFPETELKHQRNPVRIIIIPVLKRFVVGCTNQMVTFPVHSVFKERYNLFSNGNFSDSCLCFGFFHMLFYQVGECFQSYAVGKSRRNISDLMDIRPDYSNIERDGKLERVDQDEVGTPPFLFFLIIREKERSRGVETSILLICKHHMATRAASLREQRQYMRF